MRRIILTTVSGYSKVAPANFMTQLSSGKRPKQIPASFMDPKQSLSAKILDATKNSLGYGKTDAEPSFDNETQIRTRMAEL